MANFKLSRKAKADLKSIALHTEHGWGREQRNLYILQLDKCFHLLGENPELGEACDGISPDYRLYPEGAHVIFYRSSAAGVVLIIRILHKRMLPREHLL